ncbi:acyltransferase family protein [Elizabethkingia bruuniana]|uniref:acyltransferase family protein n=1 Tax=Elizabethkingia bruuniana TaxID=1756149 RepID=UPI00241CD973|nr:acyltransferase [Elizabethkingia bruuniana]
MKLSYLNSARGIAILMVIIVHVSTLYNGKLMHSFLKIFFYYGQMGVQLFFVASAFTLCLSWDNRKSDNNLISFYIRRYFRIFPIFYLGILFYFILNFYLKSVDNYSVKNILANIFLLHGMVPSAIDIVPGGWSIGTEILFYLIFPFIHRFLFSGYLVFKSLILVLACYLITFYIQDNIINNTFWYFNIIVQLPVFIIGMIYYKLNYLIKLNTGILLFLIFTLVTLYLWQNHFIVYIPLTAAISFCGMIKILEKTRINNYVFQKIGIVSYSIYIIHWVLPFYVLPKTDSLLILLIYFIVTTIVSYLIALFLEKTIEKPFIGLGQSLITKIS